MAESAKTMVVGEPQKWRQEEQNVRFEATSTFIEHSVKSSGSIQAAPTREIKTNQEKICALQGHICSITRLFYM